MTMVGVYWTIRRWLWPWPTRRERAFMAIMAKDIAALPITVHGDGSALRNILRDNERRENEL